MKPWFVLLVTLAACNAGDRNRSEAVTQDTVWFWGFDAAADTVYKHTPIGTGIVGVPKVITALNKAYPLVQLQYVKTSHDTLFVKIPDSEVLTQQMGTTGAKGYGISCTYTLTELPGIRYVHFDFEEGDHARPGTSDRNSWIQRFSDNDQSY
jgi:hypothetical protein